MNQAMRNEGRFQQLLLTEHDSCGIVCVIEKDGHPSRDNIQRTIDALVKMEHRSGFINGEGDGCGILTDIPRALWQSKLEKAGLDGKLAYDERFSIAHIFVPRLGELSPDEIQNEVRSLFTSMEVSILLEQENEVITAYSAPTASMTNPSSGRLPPYAAKPKFTYRTICLRFILPSRRKCPFTSPPSAT